jgi:hypothetical protein
MVVGEERGRPAEPSDPSGPDDDETGEARPLHRVTTPGGRVWFIVNLN